jgi:hypothetical protein
MKQIIILCLLLTSIISRGQNVEPKTPTLNIRVSFLVFPSFSPLLSLEIRTLENTTVQLESNFLDTHGVNLKCFFKERMKKHYCFIGNAFIESDYLRKDKTTTFLPYVGYGYAYRLGKSEAWIFDSRIGIGRTLNADKNTLLPVVKTGIGRTF